MGLNPSLKEEDFTKISIPIIISWGDADKMVSKGESVNAKNVLPNGFFKTYTNWSYPLENLVFKILANDIKNFKMRLFTIACYLLKRINPFIY